MHVPSGTSRSGFSLLELLIVIAMVGVLLGIVTPAYFALRARAQVAEAVQQFARDVERARLETRRLNTGTRIELTGGAAEYSWIDTTGSERFFRLPEGTQFAADADDEVAFFAPYGTVVPTGDGVLVVGIEWASPRFTVEREVRVVGVMGKVVVQ